MDSWAWGVNPLPALAGPGGEGALGHGRGRAIGRPTPAAAAVACPKGLGQARARGRAGRPDPSLAPSLYGPGSALPMAAPINRVGSSRRQVTGLDLRAPGGRPEPNSSRNRKAGGERRPSKSPPVTGGWGLGEKWARRWEKEECGTRGWLGRRRRRPGWARSHRQIWRQPWVNQPWVNGQNLKVVLIRPPKLVRGLVVDKPSA